MSRIWVEILDVIQMGAVVVSEQWFRFKKGGLISYAIYNERYLKVTETLISCHQFSSSWIIIYPTTECQKSGLKS